MVRRNIDVASRHHKSVIRGINGQFVYGNSGMRGARIALPTTFAPIPSVKEIGEPIIGKSANHPNDRQAKQTAKPDVARRAEPDSDRAVDPRIEPALAVDGMQPAPYLVHSDTK